MSIDPRIKLSDNLGWHPCIPPLVLVRALDRLDQGRGLTLRDRVAKALANLRRRLAR
jgi:hypothetical protein